MKKRLFPVLLALTLALCLPTLAAEETQVAVTLNGFDLGLEKPALAEDGVTLVPVEEFYTALVDHPDRGFEGNFRWAWDGERSYLEITGLPDLLVVPGKNGAEFRDGVLYAPVRWLAENLGVAVDWDGAVRLWTSKNRVEVDNLLDFFKAIRSDTEIVLAPGRYSFAELDLTKLDNPYVRMEAGVDSRDEVGVAEAYDLVVSGVQNLTVTAPGVTFATPWAYADVLKFENCRRLTLNGLTAVHDVEPGYCVGDCLELEDCRGVLVTGCTLDGSGAYGLQANSSENVRVENSYIRNCTYGAASLWDCRNVNISDNTVENCLGCFSLVEANGCVDVRVENCRIRNNGAGALAQCYTASREFVFQRCVFENNRFGVKNDLGYGVSGGAAFVDCEFS